MKRTAFILVGIIFTSFLFTSCCGRGCLLGKKNQPALQEITSSAE